VRGSRVFLRAETTPGSEGRRYDIEFKAKDHRGNACAGTVSVCVRNGFNACPDEPPTIESQSCKVSRRKSDCGLGGELVLVLPLWAWARHRRVRARR